MIVRTLKTATITAAATALLLAGQVVSAQQGQAQNPAAQAQAPMQSADVTDSSLQLYVQVATKITELREQFQQQMAAAGNAEEAQALQQKASGEMVAAVESFGMTVEEYNQIAYALQSDEDLRNRLQATQGN